MGGSVKEKSACGNWTDNLFLSMNLPCDAVFQKLWKTPLHEESPGMH